MASCQESLSGQTVKNTPESQPKDKQESGSSKPQPTVFTCNFDENPDEIVQLLDFSRQRNDPTLSSNGGQFQSLQHLDESYHQQVEKLRQRHTVEQQNLEKEFKQKKKLLLEKNNFDSAIQNTQSLDRKSLKHGNFEIIDSSSKSNSEDHLGQKSNLSSSGDVKIKNHPKEEKIQMIKNQGSFRPIDKSGWVPKSGKIQYRKSFRKPLIESLQEDEEMDEKSPQRKKIWKLSVENKGDFRKKVDDADDPEAIQAAPKSQETKNESLENNEGEMSSPKDDPICKHDEEDVDFEEVTELSRPSSIVFKQRLSYKVNKTRERAEKNENSCPDSSSWDVVAKKALNKLKKINLKEDQIKSLFNISSKSSRDKNKTEEKSQIVDDLDFSGEEENDNFSYSEDMQKSIPSAKSFVLVKKDSAGKTPKLDGYDYYEFPLKNNKESLNFQLKFTKNDHENEKSLGNEDIFCRNMERGRNRTPKRKESLLYIAKEQLLRKLQGLDNDEDEKNQLKEKLRDLLSRSKSLPARGILKFQSKHDSNKSELNLARSSKPVEANFGSLLVTVQGNWNNPENPTDNTANGDFPKPLGPRSRFLDDNPRVIGQNQNRDEFADNNSIKVIIDVRMNLQGNPQDEGNPERQESDLERRKRNRSLTDGVQ